MKILVVGGAGYLGVPLCFELQARGHEVRVMDRFFFGDFLRAPYWHEHTVKHDIRDMDNGIFGIWGVPNAVIDLAGLSNDATAEIDPALTQSINVDGACLLANSARNAGVKRYIYSSSASVYGHGEQQHLTEMSMVNPITDYARSKLAVEKHLAKLKPDMEVVVLRNATVFGVAPRMRFDLAVNIMTLRAWRDNDIYVMGGGEQWRPFVHIKDVVDAFVWAVEAPGQAVSGQTFNVGSAANQMTIGELAQIIHERFPEAKLHNLPEDADRRSYHLSFDKIEETGYKAKRSVRAGIAEVRGALLSGKIKGDDPTAYTLQWYKQIIEWDKRLQSLRLNGRLL